MPDKNYSKNDYLTVTKLAEFEEGKMIKADPAYGVFNAIGMIGSKKVLLRVVPNSDIVRIAGFKHELKISKVLERSISGLNFPRSISVGSNDKLTWSIREYFEGEGLTNYAGTGSVLFGYDLIKKKYQNDYLKIILWLDQNIKLIHTCKSVELIILVSRRGKRFNLDSSMKKLDRIQNILNIDLTKQVSLYNKYKNWYSENNQVPVVGDLVPANIIVGDRGKYFLSDFEWFSFDNKFLDIALFWLFLWRYPSWQKTFLQNQISSSEDKNNFLLSVIRIIISCDWHERLMQQSHEYNKHIWFRYLVAAGESFDSIMTIRPQKL